MEPTRVDGVSARLKRLSTLSRRPDRTQGVVYDFRLAYFFAAVVADHKRVRERERVALLQVLGPYYINFYR